MTTDIQCSHALEKLITNYGAPYHMRSEYANTDNGKRWAYIYTRYNTSYSTTDSQNACNN